MNSEKNSAGNPEHHELDPQLIEKLGRIPNNERRLSAENFLTQEKIDECSNLIAETFLNQIVDEWDLKNNY